MTRYPYRPHRSRRRPTPPWIRAEHIAGVLLGLALAAMAIDYGYQRPTRTLAPLPAYLTN